MSTNRDQCQIFLVIDAADGSNDRLLAALSASRVASVLIRTSKSITKPSEIFSQLVRTAQDQGVAALIENDPALAIKLRAPASRPAMLGVRAECFDRERV